MTEKELIDEWLQRARSSLEKAKLSTKSGTILAEDVCFDYQQTAEKALKSLCVYLDVVYPKTHSIGRLIELIEEKGIRIPLRIKRAIVLTDYAVETRYPGDYPPIKKREINSALNLAEGVLVYVEKIVSRDEGLFPKR